MKKIIEELSDPYSGRDLWDSFDEEEINHKILYMEPGTEYNLRLLGPFIKANRFYLNLDPFYLDLISSEDIKKIASQDESTINAVIKRIEDKGSPNYSTTGIINSFQPVAIQNNIRDRNSYIDDQGYHNITTNPLYATSSTYTTPAYGNSTDALTLAKNNLWKLYDKSKWQRCVMVNALIKNTNKITLVVLTKHMFHNSYANRPRKRYHHLLNSDKISGLIAQDISIKRTGTGKQTDYNVQVSDEVSELDNNSINYIFNKGLIDINKTIKIINNNSAFKKSSYFYKKHDEYKMPEELMHTLSKELTDIDENKAFNDLKSKMNTIPDEAFERKNIMSDPIHSLELDF